MVHLFTHVVERNTEIPATDAVQQEVDGIVTVIHKHEEILTGNQHARWFVVRIKEIHEEILNPDSMAG